MVNTKNKIKFFFLITIFSTPSKNIHTMFQLAIYSIRVGKERIVSSVGTTAKSYFYFNLNF